MTRVEGYFNGVVLRPLVSVPVRSPSASSWESRPVGGRLPVLSVDSDPPVGLSGPRSQVPQSLSRPGSTRSTVRPWSLRSCPVKGWSDQVHRSSDVPSRPLPRTGTNSVSTLDPDSLDSLKILGEGSRGVSRTSILCELHEQFVSRGPGLEPTPPINCSMSH